jgi:hypothetical protein
MANVAQNQTGYWLCSTPSNAGFKRRVGGLDSLLGEA